MAVFVRTAIILVILPTASFAQGKRVHSMAAVVLKLKGCTDQIGSRHLVYRGASVLTTPALASDQYCR